MKYIVVDLEMNPLAKEYVREKEISSNEIIEIGAVLLDERYQEISSFKTYVKPEYNDKIERKIVRLTKIKMEMVQEAPVFADAIRMFFSWCHSVPGEMQLIQWSESDLDQICKEMELKHYVINNEDLPILVEWGDLQKECCTTLGLERQISLSQAIQYAGMDFEGQPHDALFDARNTGKLLRVLKTPELCKEALSSVIEALQEKSIGTTLGELFNFSLLQGSPA